ncbi:MAG TPA: GNAT family N-acetyltransferase, partial [Pirellulales bacterium]|nr:GNAT family N-acetyltransferase [Pirellulales bacterium]
MPLQLRYLRSLAELRANAAAWDDLWFRSAQTAPVARAEMVAQWIEHFAPRAEFHAIVIEQSNQFVAALPLVGGQLAKVMRVGKLPRNEWSPGGDLLWDSSAGDASMDALAEGLKQAPWPLVWLDGIAPRRAAWQKLQGALEQLGLEPTYHDQTQVGMVDCSGDWESMQARWSGNHRRHVRKIARKAHAEGELALRIEREFASPAHVCELVQQCFAIEDRSWKGTASGSSVQRTPGMLDFFVRQAQLAAEWGQLQLVFLNFNERPIAFEFGWRTATTFYTPKVGFDEMYARFSPGQLLRHELYRQMQATGERRTIDFMGDL